MKAFKIIVLIMFAFVSIASAAVFIGEKLAADKTIPQITVEEEMIEVSLKATDEELLKGITAYDEKDGDLTGAVASREQFRLLEKYITKLLSQMVDMIASGEVEANPYTRGNSHNACAFCPYQQICRPEEVEGRRDYAAMQSGDFWERVERSVKADAGTN